GDHRHAQEGGGGRVLRGDPLLQRGVEAAPASQGRDGPLHARRGARVRGRAQALRSVICLEGAGPEPDAPLPPDSRSWFSRADIRGVLPWRRPCVHSCNSVFSHARPRDADWAYPPALGGQGGYAIDDDLRLFGPPVAPSYAGTNGSGLRLLSVPPIPP